MVVLGLPSNGQRRCGEFGRFESWTAYLREVGARSPSGALIASKQVMTIPHLLDGGIVGMLDSSCDRCQNSRSK